ncbi:MAG: osmotically inducible protein OsmC [Bacteroidetes bacterium HGW-Bacteroidetes-11]|jgi:ribosomal protein S12 methylthiotransferase accessory factor|nr:MAG: osmotically inducible protein OsmC [Bacteroidetes bacterium HGW-Bacteroidetes-11]
MKITFEGKKKIIADFNGHRIVTDQPVRAGGDGSAPAPFDLFLASIGTCAGIYVKSFCDQRGISTEGISLEQEMKFNSETHLISELEIRIILPESFPDKYKDAVVNSANLCAVKRHLHNPPEMSVVAVTR